MLDERERKRTLFLYGALEFWYWLSYGFIYPFLVLYLTEVRGLTVERAGTLWTFFWACMLLLQVPAGLLADRFGRIKMFMVAVTMGGIALWLFAAGNSFRMLLAALFLYAVSRSAAAGSLLAWVVDRLEARHNDALRSRIAVIAQLAFCCSFLVGGVAGGVMVACRGSYAAPYAAAGTLLIGLSLFAAFARRRMLTEKRGSVEQESFGALARTAVHALRTNAALRYLFGCGFVFSFLMGTLNIYWPISLRSKFDTVAADVAGAMPRFLARYMVGGSIPGYAEAVLDIPWIAGIGIAYMLFASGWLAFRVCVISVISVTLCMSAMARTAGDFWPFLLWFAAWHIGIGLYVPAMTDMLNAHAASAVRATILSASYVCGAAGIMCGQYVTGILVARVGYAAVWQATAAVFGVTFGILLWRLAKCKPAES